MAVPRLRPQRGFARAVANGPGVVARPDARKLRAPHGAARLECATAHRSPRTGPRRLRAIVRSTDPGTRCAGARVRETISARRRDDHCGNARGVGGLTGLEVVARLESAIDDLAVRLDASVTMSQRISTRRGPTTIEDYLATRIVELVVHTDDLNRSASRGCASAAGAQRPRAVHPYPYRHPRRAVSRPFRRGASAAVRRGAVCDR